MRARITAAAAHLPAATLTSAEVEARVAAASGGFRPLPTIVERMTGIRSRHVLGPGEQASDLAVAAARTALADRGLTPDALDLLVFGSASQDLIEPATAHIVAAKLGASCPVFDVKNACNSLLNGVQTAEALIRTGQAERALVCTGESPSRAIRWNVADRAAFVDAFAGYTLSDGGAAVLLEAAPDGGIFYRDFAAVSSAWRVGTLPGGGSMHPRDPEFTYFSGDGRRLKDVFVAAGPEIFRTALEKTGLTWDDFAIVAVHQVTMPYLELLRAMLEIPAGKLVVTLPEHGNLASASLPFQLATALRTGRCRPGDRVALLGLAGGVSLGVLFAEL
ncbi:3-oxoacyl-[acyl-carrier-protein] synthase 3 [Actinomadura rubteroloni]|uniref:3-oxoacyl-[acyl-carrier-protein] synthase 3 n=1 Tax=Actinomadura rubteroloni TaxID=1926885 RepID=A0A2P4UI10_9ACTN|nr:3-oxoacyl-[acyl-carrier-protein] synthase III C-terminal domain-containing protein [Actinomadura rubteroloni]POM24709.1 3-oxoacyl-[acyl-carrier-protein] synthase 3 [Actinomadura rubteroloni]